MNWTTVSHNWSSFVPRVLTRWPELDETDVIAVDGNRDKLLQELVYAYSLPVEVAQDQLADWLSSEIPSDVMMDDAQANARISASAQDVPAGEVPGDDDHAFGDDNLAATPMGRT